jgi:hypothetical protein
MRGEPAARTDWLKSKPLRRCEGHFTPGLRARDHYTSSNLIGGKDEARPSSLPTTLEGLTEYVNARWM